MYWLSTPIIKAWRTTRTPDHDVENYFNLADGTGLGRFGSLFDPASLTLSVVVPAYNEEQRMPTGVTEMVAHLKEREKTPYWCAQRGQSGGGSMRLGSPCTEGHERLPDNRDTRPPTPHPPPLPAPPCPLAWPSPRASASPGRSSS